MPKLVVKLKRTPKHDKDKPKKAEAVRCLLERILRHQERLMADFTKLNDAVAALSVSVDKLVAANQGTQPAVDAATSAVNAVNDKVVAALPPTP